MQGEIFENETSDAGVPAKRSRKKTRISAGVEVEAQDDGRPNLKLLDTRIYGLQIPITICRTDVRIIHLDDEAAEAWKKKYMPLKCAYTEHDFTPRGQVEMLLQRGYTFWSIAEDFPDLADASARMAIERGQAIA